jgi:hypothetical protein
MLLFQISPKWTRRVFVEPHSKRIRPTILEPWLRLRAMTTTVPGITDLNRDKMRWSIVFWYSTAVILGDLWYSNLILALSSTFDVKKSHKVCEKELLLLFRESRIFKRVRRTSVDRDFELPILKQATHLSGPCMVLTGSNHFGHGHYLEIQTV